MRKPPPQPEPPARSDADVLQALMRQVSADVSLICDRALELEFPETARVTEKEPARGGVHVAFRIELRAAGEASHGCLMLPLCEAATLAGYQLGLSETILRKLREKEELGRAQKAALIELSHVICGSLDAALRELDSDPPTVHSGGCQGVRDGQRPGFEVPDGAEILVASMRARIGAFEAFDLVAQLPAALFDVLNRGKTPRVAAA